MKFNIEKDLQKFRNPFLKLDEISLLEKIQRLMDDDYIKVGSKANTNL